MNKEDYLALGKQCFIDRKRYYETDVWKNLAIGEHGGFTKDTDKIAKWILEGYEKAEKAFFQPHIDLFMKALDEFEQKWNARVPGPCCTGEYYIEVDGRGYYWS